MNVRRLYRSTLVMLVAAALAGCSSPTVPSSMAGPTRLTTRTWDGVLRMGDQQAQMTLQLGGFVLNASSDNLEATFSVTFPDIAYSGAGTGTRVGTLATMTLLPGSPGPCPSSPVGPDNTMQLSVTPGETRMEGIVTRQSCGVTMSWRATFDRRP